MPRASPTILRARTRSFSSQIESGTDHSGMVYARIAARPEGISGTPNAISMFQQVMLRKASSASRAHWRFGTPRRWPPARSAAKSTAEPRPRHRLRKVHGGTSLSATFSAVQLKPRRA